MNNKIALLLPCLMLAACAPAPPPEPAKKAEPAPIPEIRAELVVSDPSWGNADPGR